MGSRIQQKLLQPGQQAPDFSLLAADGATQTLENVLAHGAAVLAFFKVSCPVCQFAFPFLERLHQSGVKLYGVSQDNAADTSEFASEFGITFPMLLDDKDFRASNDYGVSHVPSVFLIEPGGHLAMAFDGFSKAAMEALGRRFSVEVFRPDEKVPQWKPG
ncbi:MAG: redoxin domain-containing protein [Acidobacteriia bacterium]|nr:redoxin domain-containing protein [Terriglobia bacterium]